MVKFAKEELKVDVSMEVCRRSRDLAKEEITVNYRHEFKRLFDYANALMRADSDGTLDLLVEWPTPNHRPRFKRFYRLHTTLELHKLFWSCSKATSEAEFRKKAIALGEIKERSWLRQTYQIVIEKQVNEKCYNFVIPPLAGENFWPVTNMCDIEPPLPRKLPGRSKKNRIKEEGECSRTKLSKKGRRMRCKLCFKLGHNSRTYPTKIQDQDNVTSGIESVTQHAAQLESMNRPAAQPKSMTQEPVQHEVVDTIFGVPLNCSYGSQVGVSPSVVRPESRGRKITEKNQGPKKQATRTTARTSTSKRSTKNQATSVPHPNYPHRLFILR
ncbi:hypothetical protein V6N13_094390 [Hibiscus sabdariffa]